MAKGGGRGKGRPRKVVNPAQTKQAETVLPMEETGECSKDMESNETGDSEGPEIEEAQRDQVEGSADLEAKEDKQCANPVNRKSEVQLRNKGMKLGFVAPTIKHGTPIACFESDEIERENVKWKKAVIMYVIGESPTITCLTNFLKKQCLIERNFDIFYHADDYFVVKFEHVNDKDKLMYEGPYTIANRPVIVKEWEMNFCFEKEILREVPLWIRLPNLPLNCWSENSLSRIGSVVGKPICADECTSLQRRITYARMMVEVDVTQPLLYAVKVEGENGMVVNQKICYEWVPQFCQKCQRVGHVCKENRGKPKGEKVPEQVWQKKEKEKEIEQQPEVQQSLGSQEWVIPRKNSTTTIQVGKLQIPTSNTYQVMQELPETSTKQGGDLIPFNQT